MASTILSDITVPSCSHLRAQSSDMARTPAPPLEEEGGGERGGRRGRGGRRSMGNVCHVCDSAVFRGTLKVLRQADKEIWV
eukprot:756796-Hanusia_phi.AAC.2